MIGLAAALTWVLPAGAEAIGVILTVLFVGGAFALLEGMHEEIVALVPVLVVLSAGLGFGPVTALAMSLGAAVTGSSFGPTNPFLTGIALRFAGLPPLTMPALRFGLLVAAVTVWITWTIMMAPRDPARPDQVRGATSGHPWRRVRRKYTGTPSATIAKPGQVVALRYANSITSSTAAAAMYKAGMTG